MEAFSYENSLFLPCNNDHGVGGDTSSDPSCYYSSSIEAMIPPVINSAIHVESSTPQYESTTSSLTLITRPQKGKDIDDQQLTKNTNGRKQKKEICEVKQKREEKKKSRAAAATATATSNGDQEQPPAGYIHVRARRGQATDSHSLAERVRREKISERMKMLQGLVPGCDKVTGKALMLDEIINYVQSLQNQVEFLSMKLASMNPTLYDFYLDLDTNMNQPKTMERGSSSSKCNGNGNGIGIGLQDQIPKPCVLLQTNQIHCTAFEETPNSLTTVMDTSGNTVLLHPYHHHQHNGPISFLHLQEGGSTAAAECDEQRQQQQLQGLLNQVVFNNSNNNMMFSFQ